MSTQPLRFRQIHLDFHTSEDIRPIGHKFDAGQFQDALQRGHVNSVTIFAKCHHGLSYHDTKVGQRHPGLDFELMPRMIEACRAIDVKCPIYISAGLDEYCVYSRPEWIAVSRDGKVGNPTGAGWKAMGFDTPYLDYLCAQIEEVVDNYDAADGIFLDIIGARDNFSPLGMTAMEAAGVDPLDDAAVKAWNYDVLNHYYARTTAASKKGDLDRRVFHNSGHIPKGAPGTLAWNSHLELESLPTGGWGYDHFPISAKYAATTGYDFLGMTGKFHTTWGEFGGFKRPNALRYECAAMLAFGSKCSVGDQMHPSGEMNIDTYDLIGVGYAEVESKEAWAGGVTPVSDIALVSPEALRGERFSGHGANNHAEEGAARMLLETGRQFDVVDLSRDLTGYKVVILPDDFALSGAFKDKVAAYLASGGKLLLAGTAGMTAARDGFVLDLGLKVAGKSAFNPDYIVPGAKTPTPPVRGPFVVHGGAWNVTGDGYEILATRRDPYFNRAWNHFCSHQHTPDEKDSAYGAALCNGQVAYFGHSIFTSYRQLGQPLYRDLVKDVLALLLPEPAVDTNLPTAGRSSLMLQAAENRYVLHLLFAQPQKRGADNATWGTGSTMVEIIEDLFPLRAIACGVRVPQVVTGVKLVPGGEALPFEVKDGLVSFTVPELLCHQMVELSYE